MHKGYLGSFRWIEEKYKMMHMLIFCIAVVVGRVNGFLEIPTLNEDCGNSPTDVVFVLDTSDVHDPVLIGKEKEILKTIAREIFYQSNRFALITSGDHEVIQFKLDTYTSIESIETAVDYMWHATGSGNLANAIQYSLNNGFGSQNGDRPEAQNFLIVFALFGKLSSLQLTVISNMAQQNMVKLIVLNLQSVLDQTSNLVNIQVLDIPTADSMLNITKNLKEAICHEQGILKPWSSWTPCGRTCGESTRRRFRECVQRHATDKCKGKQMDVETCTLRECTDPVDGEWTYWTEWSSCSKTCGNGLQKRQRYCSAPKPEKGGKACIGASEMTQNCSQWNCPDCGYVCSNESKLSTGCEYCVCENTTLSGNVISATKRPLDKVNIYIEYVSRAKINITSDDGHFEINNICLNETTLIFNKQGYVDMRFVVGKHHTNLEKTDIVLHQYVFPVIVEQPENKVRLNNENATFCCKAIGVPTPTIEWFKDGHALTRYGSTLALTNISKSDSGKYSCFVESDAGITVSDEATLRVYESSVTSCSSPKTNMIELPFQCYLNQSGKLLSKIDIGTCGRDICAYGDIENETCSKTEDTYCCDVNQTEVVEINCGADYSYSLSRVISCKCQQCSFISTVEGQVYGIANNGSRIPFAFGYLYVNGKKAAVTNEVGYFSLEVSARKKTIVVYFVDETFNRFVPSAKVLKVEIDSTSFASLMLPLKPKPIEFNSKMGMSFDLGGSYTLPSVGGLSIPENALIDENGKPYNGKALAFVHFMDPRKITDLKSANGDFVYKTQDGKTAPLETFGMFHATVEDINGRMLKIQKTMTFTLDASLFNVSIKSDGDPDLSLWKYDVNNGIWVESAKMKFSNNNDGRRKLLNQEIIGEFKQEDIPHIDLTEKEEVYEQVIVGYTNCDHSVPIYEQRLVRRETKAAYNACFLSVTVYNDLTFSEKAGAGTNVVAITAAKEEENSQTKYKGMDNRMTDSNGHVCLSVFCDATVFVYAENKYDSSRLFASDTHDLPFWYGGNVKNKNNSELEINAVHLDVFNNRSGPFYRYEDASKCEGDFEKDFKFQLAYYAMPSTLTTTISKNIFNEKLSWYPVESDKPFAMACFIKVSIETFDSKAQLIAKSFQDSIDSTTLYGTYTVAPSFDPQSPNRERKAACIEYRCPGKYVINGNDYFDATTIVDVHLVSVNSCNISYMAPIYDLRKKSGGVDFQFTAKPGFSYGPSFGIFTGNGNAEKIKTFCNSGTDTGAVEKYMKPNINPAVKMMCS